MHLFGHVTGEGAVNLVELLEAILSDDTLSVIQIIIFATIRRFLMFLMHLVSVSSLTHWVCSGED